MLHVLLMIFFGLVPVLLHGGLAHLGMFVWSFGFVLTLRTTGWVTISLVDTQNFVTVAMLLPMTTYFLMIPGEAVISFGYHFNESLPFVGYMMANEVVSPIVSILSELLQMFMLMGIVHRFIAPTLSMHSLRRIRMFGMLGIGLGLLSKVCLGCFLFEFGFFKDLPTIQQYLPNGDGLWVLAMSLAILVVVHKEPTEVVNCPPPKRLFWSAGVVRWAIAFLPMISLLVYFPLEVLLFSYQGKCRDFLSDAGLGDCTYWEHLNSQLMFQPILAVMGGIPCLIWALFVIWPTLTASVQGSTVSNGSAV